MSSATDHILTSLSKLPSVSIALQSFDDSLERQARPGTLDLLAGTTAEIGEAVQ
jgi:hypothetical protein